MLGLMSRGSTAPRPGEEPRRADESFGDGPSDVHRKLPAEDDPLLGRVLEQRYRVEQLLGAGGVGVVYRAEHTGLRRPVALKVLRHGYEDIETMLRRFEREAKVLSQLSHPNVVALTDYGVAEKVPYLVMELLEGLTLEELLREEGPPPPEVAIEIVRSIVRGLAFAHQRGVLHRDLKPGNVFLQRLPDDPYHVKLLDFGLAKILVPLEGDEEEPTLTQSGMVVGTPAYMSPEQASGARVDARSDIYSAGVVLFELLAGKVPFESRRRTDLLRAHMMEPVPDPEALRPGLTLAPELQALLLRCLAKEPGERYRDGAALVEAFDALPEEAARYEAPADREQTRPVSVRSLADAHGAPAPLRPPSSWAPWLAFGVFVLVLGAFLLRDRAGEGAEPVTSGAAEEGARETSESQPEAPPRDAPEPPAESAESAETAPPAEPVAPALRETARDPFDAPMPARLEALAERLLAAPNLDRETHRRMRVYQRMHPDDPRPSLVLAHDFVDRGAWEQALERYRLAQSRSPLARHDPRMLADLVRAAQIDAHAEEAAGTVEAIFGADALPAVTEALARTENRARRARLRALRERLVALE
ncbi:MAG: hypothetical protein CMN31_07730 [Sandaracinus sp.]|nr:hypothetical protein [Myxococcales bacterium]MAT27943.1 hypothetical protein [Sandaracinus sp.]MBJ71217.1 hypothetical protein [Sandaracinus sp.]